MEVPKPDIQRAYELLDIKRVMREILHESGVVSCDLEGKPVQTASIQYFRTGEE